MIAETLTNRAVPASLWGMLLLAKALALSRYVQSTTAASGSAVFWAGALQQALVVGFTALIVALFATRQSVVGRQGSALGRVVAVAGTFALAVPVAHDGGEPGLAALLISSLLVLLGIALSVVSLLALGRCFGIFPEARGLVQRGPYRRVRHPLYLGEMITALGLIVPGVTVLLVLLFVAFCGLQLARAHLEEAALEASFPDYRAYRQRSWCLAPGFY